MPQINSENNNPSFISEAQGFINKEFVKSVPDPMCLLDLQCRIVIVNEGAMKLFGSQPETFFIGKSILDFIIPEEHPQVLEGLNHCLNTNQTNQSEYSILTEEGAPLPIRTTSFIVLDKMDRPIALCSLVKESIKHDEPQELSFKHSQRAQLYCDLLGHDISNKLQVIMSSAELLQDSLNSPIESQLIQNVIESVSSCKLIINSIKILEDYNDKPLKIQYLDVIVKTALLELIKSCKDVAVHANIQVCDASILCDEYVGYLLSNILDNAWLHNIRDNKRVWVKLSENNDGYVLSISDNGPGITSETRTKGTHLEGRSAGIGLYICHALIEKYQGRIQIVDRIENQSDQGTQVSVWFPRLD